MSKRGGNINYKYLRRRKSWFRRNLGALTAYAIVILLLIGVIVFLMMKFSHNRNDNGGAGQSSTVAVQTTEAAKEVNWVELKEHKTEEVSYTAPEGVQFPYFIRVNRAANCVTVYGIDEKGEYSIPVKAFAASCGREGGHETILGDNFQLTDSYVWRLMVDNTYGHYAYRIKDGYLFHSVPYLKASNDTLETEEFNKLGSFASLGCVRMCVRDVLWLHDNCPFHTPVEIYDDEANPGPLGKPETIKIPLDSPNAGWDPTDPNESNPWLKESAKIAGAKDISVKVGQNVDLRNGVTATDTCGNDITAKIEVITRYTLDVAGEYTVTYKVTDAIGSVATQSVKLVVTE